MQVSAVMTPDPVVVFEETRLDEALRLMSERDIRHLPVLRGEKLVGVLSDRDVLAQLGWLPSRVYDRSSALENTRRDLCVGSVMETRLRTIGPNGDLADAITEMIVSRIGSLLVVDGDKLCGIVTELDVLRAYIEAARGGQEVHIERRMARRPASIPWFSSLGEAIDLCLFVEARHLPVLQHAGLVGIVSDRDLRRARGVGRQDAYPISELMTRDVITTRPERTMVDAAEVMVDRGIGALPVLDERDLLVGVISRIDVIGEYLRLLSPAHHTL